MGANLTTMVQLEFAASVRPMHVSELRLSQLSPPYCMNPSASGPAEVVLMFVTVKVAEVLVPAWTDPKFLLEGVTASRASPDAPNCASA